MTFTEWGPILICITSIIVSLVQVLLHLMERTRERKLFENTQIRAQLDSFREYYESKIYEMQKELTANRRRWSDANHVILNGQSKALSQSYCNNDISARNFLKNLGIDYQKIKVDRKSVFVLTPFLKQEYDTFLKIKHACSDMGLTCTRGDEVYMENDILSHIVTNILQANVIIANINGRNPNVLYELGICHTIGKVVIMISESSNNLPFDINGKNVVMYNNSEELEKLLKAELLKIFITE